MPKNKRIDEYIKKSANFARPILTHIRELVHYACPDVVETIKWSFPNFEYHGIMCSMAAFKQHCAFGFWKVRLMDDYDKLMTGKNKTSMGHFGQLKSLNDLPSDRILIQYIREACRLNEAGIKIVRKSKPDAIKIVAIPLDLKKALGRNKAAGITFENFNYSNRKDYVDWITEAKTEATRQKRLYTTIEWLAEGKIRNWKYVL
ncbi:hypothetical protein BH10BAC4_BH10BAC4_13870 [soil metagenome]